MSLKVGVFWSVLAIITLLFLQAVHSILLPFVMGIVFAYLLDPVVDRLEAWKWRRSLAALCITIVFFVVIIGALALLFPMLLSELVALIKQLPGYYDAIQTRYAPTWNQWLERMGPDMAGKVQENIAGWNSTVLSYSDEVLQGTLKSGLGAINTLSLLFISPIVTFYFLNEWDRLAARIKALVPETRRGEYSSIVADIDTTLSGYLRGQLNVCLLLAAFYAIGLTLTGLQYGMVIGIAAGLLSFIPYIGLAITMVVGLLVAVFQFGDVVNVLIVLGVFVAGQMIEGNFITPKLVGDKVGLHPLWIMFALLSGGALFGFTGVMVAIPVASILGVLVRFLVEKYKQSDFYKTNTPKKRSANTSTTKSKRTRKKAS